MGAKKILVIDDEEDIGELIRDCLSHKGYEVFYALYSEQGIQLAIQEKPQLIFLDILLPGIGGLECLKKLKQVAPESEVIVISGVQSEEVAKEAIRRGAYDFISKPFDLQQLEEQILPQIFSE